jgi:phosphatidylglycerol:prolipoprotein diacylglycerol transferase
MYPFNLFIGQFSVSNYELLHFLGLSFLVIFEVTLLDKNVFINKWQVLVTCTIGILTGTTGAKLTHLLLYAEKYRGMSPEQVLLKSGHAYIGGAALALLAVYILFRYYKVSFLYAGDYTLPFFGLFRAVGRLGCLLTGCCHGSASCLPWAAYFRDGVLRHPTQAYMIILTFSIFVAGRAHYRKLRDTPGIIFFSSVMLYGLGRFFVEFFRVDSPYILGTIKLSHIVLIAVFIYGTVGLSRLYRRYSRKETIAPLIRRYFITFTLSSVIMSVMVLTILSLVPKINYTDEIDLRIGRGGIRREEVRVESPVNYERVEKIKRALEMYKADNGDYPTQEQGLKALVEKPAVKPSPTGWRGPYIDNRLLLSEDGTPYEYIHKIYGDMFSYKIKIPISKRRELYLEKRRDYLLKIEVHHALARYRFDNGAYPTQEQGLKALMEKPKILPIPRNWNGPYLEGELKNKQGKKYGYEVDEKEGGESYRIYTH